MYEPLEEWNLRTEALIASYVPNLENIKTYHLTSEHLPRICPHPQTSVLTAWILAGLSRLPSLPINTALSRSSDLLITLCSMHSPNCNPANLSA